MDKFISSIKSFAQDEEGLTVVEYVIGAALLVAAISVVFSNLGNDLNNKLTNTISSVGS
ncbi:Flp family type IVb pilin [Vibrio sp. B1Z05]|uniref:Flp family type IVb pilin n=1 Tax=Vibrio sp. B1Z05 TaxID=2654980 RepID=UPI00128D9B8E|nr:Flp family type IVb pilin [Vibrio sp. B1Z05]MPW37799.1 Flp family type IVb pilin [Vibrio sp. B1Z05]